MKLFKVNKYLIMAALFLVTALLFVLGKGHEAAGIALANTAVVTLTDEEKKDLNEDSQKTLLAIKKHTHQMKEDILGGVMTKDEGAAWLNQVKKEIEKFATSESLEALKTSMKGLEDILKTQGDVLTEIKLGGSAGKGKTLVQTVKDEFEGIKKSTKKGYEHEFEVKADTLRASVDGNQNALQLTEIGQLAHRKLTVYDIFRKVPVPKNNNGVIRYVDWDADTIVRAAKAIAEGTAYDTSTAKWKVYTLSLEKVGDMIPLSEEMLYDAELFAAELENFLRVNVAIKIDDNLITGDGASPNMKGLLAQVPAYAPVAAGIADASIYDLIVKVRESITKDYGSKYNPDVALMNITDINRMKLKKDANNNYILPPFFDKAGNVVDGVIVLECNTVTANSMILGDSRYGAIYEEPGTKVETGFATGDFESDMMTIKARKRLNLLIRKVDQTGWKKVTDIDAAITTIAA